MPAAAFHPFFLDDANGAPLFCLHHPPQARPCRGAVLHLAAMGEEMNRSRLAVAQAARVMAAAGWAVLQVDLTGCGDSGGDFEDATWPRWLNDVARARRWLAQQHPDSPVWLWGHRAGALLAAQHLQQGGAPAHLLFWHPTSSGEDSLRHWLRLKAAGALTTGDGAAIAAQARADWAAGRAVHVGGYAVSPGLVAGLQAATLAPPSPPAPTPAQGQRLVWLDTSPRSQGAPLPAAGQHLAAWAAAGWHTTGLGVAGPQFWQTAETEAAPALTQATLAQLEAACA